MGVRNPDLIAYCLRTGSGGSNVQRLMFVDGPSVCTRKITPLEYARVMGLPEFYELPSARGAAYNLIGDGVSPPVIRHLARYIFEPLLGRASETAEPSAFEPPQAPRLPQARRPRPGDFRTSRGLGPRRRESPSGRPKQRARARPPSWPTSVSFIAPRKCRRVAFSARCSRRIGSRSTSRRRRTKRNWIASPSSCGPRLRRPDG